MESSGYNTNYTSLKIRNGYFLWSSRQKYRNSKVSETKIKPRTGYQRAKKSLEVKQF